MENSYNWENSITEGPCCNHAVGDHEWNFKPNGGITKIKVRFGRFLIHSITFESIDEKGNILSSNKFGGDDGAFEQDISPDWPNEYLTKLSGICFITNTGSPAIGSLCIETNLKKYGPFSHMVGTPFEFGKKDEVIVGFHGRFGKHVNTIGVYIKRSAELFWRSSQLKTVTPKENSYNWENSITKGPCCNRAEGDHEWRFKPNGGITKIKVRCGVVLIHSITFESTDEKGNIETSNKFGGDAGAFEHIISLKWPEEYLTKLSGMCFTTKSGSPGIGSLCFETNLNKHGPFSLMGGTPFEFCEKDGVIVGFHGRFRKYVSNIGVYINIKRPAELSPSSQIQPKEQSYNFDNSTKIWHWGSRSRSKFLDEIEWDYRPKGGIVEITICYSDNEVIHALSFKNVDKNGKVECSRKFGGNGGEKKEVIMVDWPSEYLTSVSWTCDTFNSHYVVQSLCFETNKKKCGPFGPTTGTSEKFSKDKDGEVIVGFHGYHGIYVDVLGYYVKNSTDLFGPSRPGQVVTAKVDSTILMNMDMPRPLGPWGGITGKPWDDERFPFIKQIDVHIYNGIVHAIQIQYLNVDGKTVESKRHGGGVDSTVHIIKLDVPAEYISGVMGFYGPIDENASYDVVRSLSFYSNKGKYGPFGKEIGIFFSSPIYNGKVVGFHGKSGDYLEAIGVHMN